MVNVKREGVLYCVRLGCMVYVWRIPKSLLHQVSKMLDIQCLMPLPHEKWLHLLSESFQVQQEPLIIQILHICGHPCHGVCSIFNGWEWKFIYGARNVFGR